jgi:hypothetical protein
MSNSISSGDVWDEYHVIPGGCPTGKRYRKSNATKGVRGEANCNSKLTADQVTMIRRLRQADPKKWPYWKLGKKFGVNQEIAMRICHRTMWKHVEDGIPAEPMGKRHVQVNEKMAAAILAEFDARQPCISAARLISKIATDYDICYSTSYLICMRKHPMAKIIHGPAPAVTA